MFRITAKWETLSEGAPEEIACFAALQIDFNNVVLTQGHDPFVDRVRDAPLLSAYHLAEWLVWNWWRLRWEPRGRDAEWRFAHALATAGEGYVWPPLTVLPDGERVTLVARQSSPSVDFAFRYLNDFVGALSAAEFEGAIEGFVGQVLGQLEAKGLRGTNLERLWADLDRERRDERLATYRRIEAMLGHDPDEGPADRIERLLADQDMIGFDGVAELAADSGGSTPPVYAADLVAIAERSGAAADLRDVIAVHDLARTARATTPAWLVGQRAAQAVRGVLGNASQPLNDAKLAGMAAVAPTILTPESGKPPLSFSLRNSDNHAKIVLRSRWNTGRRFDLARILGDVVASGHNGPLIPATRSSTYRQKLQRAFAAELLSPYEAVEDFLGGDYSDEQQEEAAAYFMVSPLTVRTLLVNHGRLDWDDAANDRDYEHRMEAVNVAQ